VTEKGSFSGRRKKRGEVGCAGRPVKEPRSELNRRRCWVMGIGMPTRR